MVSQNDNLELSYLIDTFVKIRKAALKMKAVKKSKRAGNAFAEKPRSMGLSYRRTQLFLRPSQIARSYFVVENAFNCLFALLKELSGNVPACDSQMCPSQHTKTLACPCNIFLHSGSVLTAFLSSKGRGPQKIVSASCPA